jgi:hypothetical protein
MKIEAGKYYRTRDGRKAGPMVTSVDDDQYAFYAAINGKGGNKIFQADGSHGGTRWIFNEPCNDLISEWPSETLTPHQQRTAEMIKVMQAYVEGERVELQGGPFPEFSKVPTPLWDWLNFDYRIAPAAKPDTIDWSHVAPEFKWMARDSEGQCWLYFSQPKVGNGCWYSPDDATPADSFTSYHRGTCDWKDSLVKRPE